MKNLLLLLVLVTLNSMVSYAQSVDFQPYVIHTTGSSFEFVDSGDFDGDGDLDIVGATTFANDPVNDYMVFIWINNNGVLADPIKLPYGGSYQSRAMGITMDDLDNDGTSEIVLLLTYEVRILKYHALNNIENNFSIYTGETVDGVSIGDVDGDGRKDIAISHWMSDWISVLYNENNNFSFTKINYPMASAGYDQILVGRLDNDNYNSIIYMRGQGLENDIEILKIGSNRAIQETKNLNLLDPNVLPRGIALGNSDNSTNNKLAITSGGNMPNAWYSLSNGNMLQNTTQTFHNAETVRFANVTGDGRDELVILHGGYQTLSIHDMLTYQVMYFDVPYASHYQPTGMTVGDFNGDGKEDIALANYNYGLVILYNSSTLSINDRASDLEISIYPNPTSDYINVKTQEEIQFLELYDMLGRKIQQVNSLQMNITKEAKNTYILKVTFKNGEKIFKKVMKQ